MILTNPDEVKEIEVKEIIDKIKKKSAGATFIYRGEAECYCKVSSSLYRVCAQLEEEDFFGDTKDIQGVMKVLERKILKMAKSYLCDKTKDEILSHLQHYGGATNLIDFTRSCAVALFFACNKAPGKNGRVILLEEKSVGEGKGYRIVDPSKAISRAKAQKSVFVASDTGVLEIEKDKDMVVCIPKDLKLPILDYLSDSGLDIQAIYDDWAGVIERVNIYRSAFRELAKAQKYEKDGHNKKAIEHYDAADHYRAVATWGDRWFELYIRRAQVHLKRDDYAAAEADYSKARGTRDDDESEVDRMAIAAYTEKIESNPCDANAYLYRGKVYARKSESDKASPGYQKVLDNTIADYQKAIELNPDNAEAYYELGNVYRAQKDLNNALKSYDKALDLDLDDLLRDAAHYERGVVHLLLGNKDKGIEDLRKAGVGTQRKSRQS